MMVGNHQTSGTAYRARLADIMRRAEELELRARSEYSMLSHHDPQHDSWVRIERRYATVRGNAQHLLLIHDRKQQLQQPINRLLRYLHLF